MRQVLVCDVKEHEIKLCQNYTRVGKQALHRQGRYAHAQQYRKARKETRKLKTYLGRVERDIRRKVTEPNN